MGNFPQAFSHVSLVNAAFNLSGHPAMGEQIVADQHLLRRAAKRWGRAGSTNGLASSSPGPAPAGPGHPIPTVAKTESTKKRRAR